MPPDADDVGLCICDEQWCFCPNTVTFDEKTKRKVLDNENYRAPCPECAAGHHVLRLDGPRS